MRDFFLTRYLAALSPVRKPYRSQQMRLTIDKHAARTVERIVAFLREHSGSGHDVTVVHERGSETLVCTCGAPDLRNMPVRRERTLLT